MAPSNEAMDGWLYMWWYQLIGGGASRVVGFICYLMVDVNPQIWY